MVKSHWILTATSFTVADEVEKSHLDSTCSTTLAASPRLLVIKPRSAFCRSLASGALGGVPAPLLLDTNRVCRAFAPVSTR